MKKNTLYLSIAALIIVGISALVYYQFSKQPDDMAAVAKETVVNDTVNLEFAYPSGEKGLALVEPPAGEKGLLAAYVLIPTKEYEDFKQSTDSREAPAAISVLVYSLESATGTASTGERIDRVTRLQNWAIDNNVLTSFSQAKATPDIVEIDGVKALHYQADGLYQQDIYLASYQSKVYMFVGQYDSPSDITNTAFPELISSVLFD